MKLFYFLLLIFFSHQFAVQAQFLVVNIKDYKSKDCDKDLMMLDKSKVNLPIFIVFPSSSKNDSVDIEDRYQFSQLGFHYLFNDELYIKTHDKNGKSFLHYFDKDLQVVWKKDLKILDKNFLKDSVFSLQLPLVNHDRIVTTFTKDFIYDFNLETNVLIIKDRKGNIIRSISHSDIPKERLYEILTEEERSLVPEPKSDPFFDYACQQNIIFWEGIDSQGNIFLNYEFEMYRSHESKNSSSKVFLAKLNAQGDLEDFYNVEDTMRTRKIFPFGTLFPNPNQMINIVYNPQQTDFNFSKSSSADTAINFLILSQLDNNQIEFDSLIKYPLPQVYVKQFQLNGLSLFSSAYPIIALPLANEIYNLENHKKANLIDETLYKKHNNFQWKQKGDIDKTTFKVNQTTILSPSSFCVAYSINDTQFLNFYSSDMQLKKVVDLGFMQSYLGSFGLKIDASGNRIIFTQKKGNKQLVLPLQFFS